MSSELIFLTGGSGFLGGHILEQLLEGGYRVRAAARGAKVAQLQAAYGRHGKNFEAIDIPDLVHSQFPEAFERVSAVIHTAAPLPGRAEGDAILRGAIDGTTNVLRQALKAGVKRFVVTSTIGTVFNPRNTFTDKDWNPITKEEAIAGSNMQIYIAGKTLAEKALWELADQNKDADFTAILPPVLLGPFASGFTLPEPNFGALSTNGWLYKILTPNGAYPALPGYADVRDVARAHVGALKSAPASAIGRKRVVFAGEGLDYADVPALLTAERPALRDRLSPKENAHKAAVYKLPVDRKRAEEVTGVSEESYFTWQESVLGAVDSLLALETEWKQKGFNLDNFVESE